MQPEAKLEVHEIRDLAVRGVAALGIRTLIIRMMGLAANLVLARLLTPHDFGLMAFGLAVVALGGFLTDGGLGAALLRLESVQKRQLQAMFGAQLLLASLTALVIVAIAAPLGTPGGVAAIMALSLPLDCAKVPGSLSCERRLNYSPIIRTEIAEMLVYNGVAVTAVALGAGIWGVAAAVPCRALVGAIVLAQQSRVFVRPRLLWAEARPLYAFGVQFQGLHFVSFVRDQGLNVATTVIGGFAVLGTMSLVQRLTQPIWMVFDGSWRVSFPAMSRLRDAGRELPAIAVRTLKLASMTTGLAAVAVASATPALVPSLFGPKWDAVIPVMPIVLATLLIGGPMLACSSGFFATIGEPGKMLRAEIAGSVVAFAVALPLLPVLGAPGLAAGTLAATFASATVLAHGLRQHGVHVGRALVRSNTISLAAGTLGWLLADALPSTLWAAALGGLAGSVAYGLLVWLFMRETVQDAATLAKRVLPNRTAAAPA